jgi:hypothetical protein
MKINLNQVDVEELLDEELENLGKKQVKQEEKKKMNRITKRMTK